MVFVYSVLVFFFKAVTGSEVAKLLLSIYEQPSLRFAYETGMAIFICKLLFIIILTYPHSITEVTIMSKLNLTLVTLLLFAFFIISACDGIGYNEDTTEDASSFPTTFQGLEHDIIFTADGNLMRLSNETNEVSPVDIHGIRYIPHNLRLSSGGRFLYFVDRGQAWGEVGYIRQLDLIENTLRQMPVERMRSFTLINDDFILGQMIPDSCSELKPFYIEHLYRLEDGVKMSFCEAYSEYAAANNAPQNATSKGVSYRDGVYTSYFIDPEVDEATDTWNAYMVRFEVSADQLEVIGFEQVTERTDGILSRDGNLKLISVRNEGLFIKDTNTGESSLIDENVATLTNVRFVMNDSHVLVRKPRSHSTEVTPRYGYHLYEISTGRYRQLLEESSTMQRVRFSESGSQIIALAKFRRGIKWQVVVMSFDEERKALISDLDVENLYSEFVY